MLWVFVTLAAIALAAFLAIQYAISRNGPAVLDAVDRITGGARDVAVLARAQYGKDPAQKLIVQGVVGDTSGGGKARPVILFVHGGSWNSGDPDNYNFIARALAPEGFVVVLAGYRLGRSGHFPAMVEDTAAALAWTRDHVAQYGGDPHRTVLMGHSAGAYNIVMATLDRQWLGRAGLSDKDIAGVIGLAGPYDFYPFTSDASRAAFGDADEPEATQPIRFARGDAPPMLLLTGDVDTTVRPRNTRVLAAALSDAGGRAETGFYPAFDHNRILMALASPWRRDRDVLDRVVRFAAHPQQTSVPVQPQTR